MVGWAIAAHLIAPASLGVMTAVLAAITTPAIAVATMIGDAYTALLPAVGRARSTIFRRGQRLFLASSALGGLIGGVATIIAIDEVRHSLAVCVLVVCGTMLVCASMLQNSVLAAIGRARWLVVVTATSNLLRVTMLCAFALTFQWHSLELATVISAGLVAVAVSPTIRRIIYTSNSLPDNASLSPEESISEFNKFIPRSFVSTMLGYAIFYFTPFLVTAFSNSTEGALFALALPVAQTIDLISTSMGTSLVVHGATEPGEASAMARSVMKRAIPIAALAAVCLAVAAPVVLRFLNPVYGSLGAFGTIAVLCLASVVRVPFSIWAALQRSRRNLRPSIMVTFVGAVVVAISVPMLSRELGAIGGSLGVLAAYTVLLSGAVVHMLFMQRKRRALTPV
jgi:O-antigen/teichoic acid export membrane protein